MPRFLALTGTTALTSVLLAAPALADLTASEVWAEQKSYLEGFGYDVTATEEVAGDTLTITGYTMTIPIPDEDAVVTATLPDVMFTNQSDGTVAFSIGQSAPITMDVVPNGGDDPVRVGMMLTSAKLGAVISGDASNMTYTYDSDDLKLALTEVTVEGANVVPGIISFEMTATEFDGTTISTKGNARTLDQSLTLGDFGYAFAFDDPDTGEEGTFNAQIASVAFNGTSLFPLEMDTSDPAALFAGDFAFDGAYEAGPGNTTFNVNSGGEITSGALSSQSSKLGVSMEDGAIGYELGATGQNVAIQGGELPFPIQFAMDTTRLDFTVPLAKKETSQNFGMGLTLGGFTMADLLWSIFDPAGQLPRDPATIDLDLEGSLKLLVNLFDEAEMAGVEAGETLPGELETLSLKNLLIEAVGAKLTGMGDFTFDNTDMTTYDGIPKPVGAVDLQLSGANALIDTLIAMGLLPEEQAMGARMMMSMFAVPAGEDVLNSKIELNEQGQILANGQRIR